MMLAQRFPNAYDGIHASAPAIYWNQLFGSAFWVQFLMNDMEYYPYPCEINAITDAAVKACNGLDGVIDGIIADEASCRFDPLSVAGTSFNCSDTGKNMKVSKEAAILAKATWAGPRTKDGKFLWYGPNIGSQLSGSTTALTNDIGLAMTECSNGTCAGVPVGLGEVWWKYYIKSDPDWSYTNMTHEEYESYFRSAIQRYDSIIGTSDTDLSAFHKTGGKILGYHGMVSEARHFTNTSELTRCRAIRSFPSKTQSTTTIRFPARYPKFTISTEYLRFQGSFIALAAQEVSPATHLTPLEPGSRTGQSLTLLSTTMLTLTERIKTACFARIRRRLSSKER
jgi:hypothetical protein